MKQEHTVRPVWIPKAGFGEANRASQQVDGLVLAHHGLGHLGLDYTPQGFLLVVQEGGVKVPDYMNSDFAGQQKSCGTCIQTPGLHGQPGRAPHRPPGGCPDLLEAGDTRSSAEGKDSWSNP